jgi:hypothetical protein
VRAIVCAAAWVAFAVSGVLPAWRPTPASAAEALHLSWGDCDTGSASVHDNPFTCATDVGSASLYCAFSLASPVDQVVGLELVVDLQHSAASLPDYWLLGPYPDCRHDQLTASLDFSLTTACTDPAFAGAAVQGFLPGQPGGLSSQARIKAVAFVPSPQTRSFSADTLYDALRLVLSYNLTVGSGSCGGCSGPACLVLNSILLRRVSGAPGGDIMVTAAAPANGNWVTWRGGVGANCQLVPVRARTWGSIKSLYR